MLSEKTLEKIHKPISGYALAAFIIYLLIVFALVARLMNKRTEPYDPPRQPYASEDSPFKHLPYK